MENFKVGDYLIITDVTKVNGLEDMNFVSWYPYEVINITKDGTAVINNGKRTFVFTPLEMQHVIKANENQVEKAFTKYKKGDKVVVPDVSRLLFENVLDITNGKEYEVYDIDKSGLPIIKDDLNCRLGFLKEDLLFINRIETFDEQVEDTGNYSELIDQYKIGDSVLITDLGKIKDAKPLKFFYGTPYEIVNILKQIQTIVIRSRANTELIISKDELQYIKPHVDTKMIEEVHKFIDELEKKCIEHNLSVMMDEALKERNYARAKEVEGMRNKFN